jgi:hypothetical protein
MLFPYFRPYQLNGVKVLTELIKAFGLSTVGMLEYLSLHGLSNLDSGGFSFHFSWETRVSWI